MGTPDFVWVSGARGEDYFNMYAAADNDLFIWWYDLTPYSLAVSADIPSSKVAKFLRKDTAARSSCIIPYGLLKNGG